MADTIKLSGTYDSIEAYNILTDIEALEVTIQGYKTDAETAATNAGTSETNAGTSATNAGTSESNASTYAGNALASANAAAGSESAASASAGAASASATLASQWASKTGGAVADGKYSAKYYAQAAANSATNAAASAAVVTGALPLSGGTMTGALTLADGGTALSNATVGTVVDDSTSSAVSIPQSSATTVVSINLDKGNWVITGHAYFNNGNVTADKVYSIGIGTTANALGYGDDGTMTMHASFSGHIVLQTVRILQIGANNTTVYLNSLCNVATSISVGRIRAIRIV